MIFDGLSNRARRRIPGPPAFSLLELLIVMAIIVIMFTMYWSAGSRGFQQRQLKACERHLQNIYVGLQTFAVDTAGRLPFVTNAVTSEAPLSLLVPKYTTGTEYFTCPGTGDAKLPDAQPFAGRRISYAYYMGRTIQDGAAQPLVTDRQVNVQDKTAGAPLFSPDGSKPGNNHHKYGGNLMFCDGNVQYSAAKSAFVLTNPPNVVLLNPKP